MLYLTVNCITLLYFEQVRGSSRVKREGGFKFSTKFFLRIYERLINISNFDPIKSMDLFNSYFHFGTL